MDGAAVGVMPLELPQAGLVLHTLFADAELRWRTLIPESASNSSNTTLQEWRRRLDLWSPPDREHMEWAYPEPVTRTLAYINDLLVNTNATGFLSPFYIQRLRATGIGQRLRSGTPAYYALVLDNAYQGMAFPSLKEYWTAVLGNKDYPPKAVTCSWPLRAIAHEWKRSTPAYQYAIEPNNARSIWLFVVAGCGAAEDRFDTYWSAYGNARAKNSDLTWPEYLWQRFGK